jgi:hypothetical protein
MWGTSVVGFGCYRYRYDSGHEGTAALVGFSPRKANLVLYLVGAFRTGIQSCYSSLVPTRRERATCTSNTSTT